VTGNDVHLFVYTSGVQQRFVHVYIFPLLIHSVVWLVTGNDVHLFVYTSNVEQRFMHVFIFPFLIHYVVLLVTGNDVHLFVYTSGVGQRFVHVYIFSFLIHSVVWLVTGKCSSFRLQKWCRTAICSRLYLYISDTLCCVVIDWQMFIFSFTQVV
jgi:hypothetical protein